MIKNNSLHKIILIGFAIMGGMMLSPLTASSGIRYSKHDFSFSGSQGSQFAGNYINSKTQALITEVCVFCHTPHGASTAPEYRNPTSGKNQYLWNRVVPDSGDGTGYLVYTSASLSSNVGNKQWLNGGTSLMCMSCHDGVTTVGGVSAISGKSSELNASGTDGGYIMLNDPFNSGIADQIGQIYNPNDMMSTSASWGANIGNYDIYNPGPADLSDDHPVAFPWQPGLSGIIEPTLASNQKWPTGLRLFSGRMECSTCHDPHDTTNPPFLRMSNAGSNMCRTCHNK